MNNEAQRDEHDSTSVDVIFIDKYIDPAKSQRILNRLQDKFQFADVTRSQLCSGYPVTIKRSTNVNSAKALIEFIARLGGDCWMQSSSEDFNDRRGDNRREHHDRRQLHRGWAITPDRRKAKERRIFFH